MHLMFAEAWCVDCNWKTEGKNSMGNAARHHKSTGHYVQMELSYGQTFGNPHGQEQFIKLNTVESSQRQG